MTRTVTRRNNYGRSSNVIPFSGIGRSLRSGYPVGRLGRFAGSFIKAAAPSAFRYGAKKAYQYLSRPSNSVKKSTSGIKEGKVMNEGTGGQYSMFVPPKGKCYLPKHVEDALPPLSLTRNFALQSKSSVGQQQIVNVDGVFKPELATTYTGDNITRVLYHRANYDITMNNIYLSNCYIIIYDIMARKDVGSVSIGTPPTAWIQGDTDLGQTGGYATLGSTPWQSEVFNQYWEVKQVTNVVLAAGATHVHKARLEPNKIVSSAYGRYTPYALKDVTYYCMIEFHGSPANDITTQTQVSVGVGGLNIIVDKEEVLKQLQKTTPTLQVTNSLPTSFTAGEQVVNMGGSIIQTNAEG